MFMKLWDNNLFRRTFMVLGAIILVGAVALAQGCSRQVTPQEQREQMRAAQVARGEKVTTRSEWVQIAEDVWRLNDEENGAYCYLYNPTGKDNLNSAARFDCFRS